MEENGDVDLPDLPLEVGLETEGLSIPLLETPPAEV